MLVATESAIVVPEDAVCLVFSTVIMSKAQNAPLFRGLTEIERRGDLIAPDTPASASVAHCLGDLGGASEAGREELAAILKSDLSILESLVGGPYGCPRTCPPPSERRHYS